MAEIKRSIFYKSPVSNVDGATKIVFRLKLHFLRNEEIFSVKLSENM